MAMKAIVKSASKLTVTPNLVDYDAACAPGFWERAREELDGLPGDGGLNIAYEAVDRHASGARADHLALRCLGKRGKVHDFTYAALGGETSRFAKIGKVMADQFGPRRFRKIGRLVSACLSEFGTDRTESPPGEIEFDRAGVTMEQIGRSAHGTVAAPEHHQRQGRPETDSQPSSKGDHAGIIPAAVVPRH